MPAATRARSRVLGLDVQPKAGGAIGLSPTQASVYRRLTICDEGLLSSLLSSTPQDVPGLEPELDADTRALVRMVAPSPLGATGRPTTARSRRYSRTAPHLSRSRASSWPARRSSATPIFMKAAPRLALALGYVVDAGLEDPVTAE
jgi:hypothetical protein